MHNPLRWPRPRFGCPACFPPRLGALLCFQLLLSALAVCAQPKSGLRLPPEVDLVEAESKGRRLIADLLAQKPAQNSTNHGIMTIRGRDGKPQVIAVEFEMTAVAEEWVSRYETISSNSSACATLVVNHHGNLPNQYCLTTGSEAGDTNSGAQVLVGNAVMLPFAGSDFWVGDLGLEFLHWPKQLLLRKEMKRGRSCDVVQSVNPHPGHGAYSRVDCWIDGESGGIVHADAFDSQNKLLKQFDPKEFKKIQGQWQLEGMEIRNAQTGSRTRIDFDLTSSN